ncbi:MAG: helix-turn-helix transcriptional regulator [Oscillospiraceae bacterium]
MKNRIRELRKSLSMSQKKIADLLGVSASTIGMYEQERRDPDAKMLLKLAREFDVSVDYLICATDHISHFDADTMAKNIALDLMENKALLFSNDCYTQDELIDLRKVIEQTVKLTINNLPQKEKNIAKHKND